MNYSSYFVMKNGHWLAIREGIVNKIKPNKPASIGDFALIVTQIYRKETPTSAALLAKRLCWSHRKVRSWLGKVGLEIEYFGKVRGSSKGVLKAVPKENLDPDNNDLWIIIPSEKPEK